MSTILQRFPTAMLVMAVSLSVGVLAYLFGLYAILPAQYIVPCVLALGMVSAPVVYLLLNRFVKTRIMKLPPLWRWLLLVTVMLVGALGLWLWPFQSTAEPWVYLLVGALGGASLLITALLLTFELDSDALGAFYIPASVMLLYLVIGLLVYDDYGVSTDEPMQRQHALVVVVHYIKQAAPSRVQDTTLPPLYAYEQRFYGVATQLPLVALDAVNDLQEHQRWLLRHYLTFLFVFVGTLFFYRLVLEALGSWRLALLGVGFLVLTPRIFAESFYNIKDVLFLACFAIALTFGFKYWRTASLKWGFLFAIATALAMTIRIVALGLLIFVLLVRLFDMLTSKTVERQAFVGLMGVTVLTVVAYLALSPASYSGPLLFLGETIGTFSAFSDWDDTVMFMGKTIRGAQAPWFYLPVWFVITVPPIYIILFILGVVAILHSVSRLGWRYLQTSEREALFFFVLFLVPPSVAVILNSTVYNAWRHFTFIYIPFLLVALYGVQQAWRWLEHWRYWRYIAAIVTVGGSLLLVGGWMVKNHPHQNVYFSPTVALFGGRANFERDYWRLSVRQGVEYLLAADSREQIRIASTDRDLTTPILILEPVDRARIEAVPVDSGQADYIIETYRRQPQPYDYPLFYEIRIDGLEILTIYSVTVPAAETR